MTGLCTLLFITSYNYWLLLATSEISPAGLSPSFFFNYRSSEFDGLLIIVSGKVMFGAAETVGETMAWPIASLSDCVMII